MVFAIKKNVDTVNICWIDKLINTQWVLSLSRKTQEDSVTVFSLFFEVFIVYFGVRRHKTGDKSQKLHIIGKQSYLL